MCEKSRKTTSVLFSIPGKKMKEYMNDYWVIQ